MKVELASPARQERFHQAMTEVFGVQDVTVFEIVGILLHIGNLMERVADCALQRGGLSNARLRLMVPLLVAEQLSPPGNISPTMLSRHNNVSRNTVSALLAGLEEQGFISREDDPDDRRRVRIRLTDAGRTVVRDQAPRFSAQLESTFSDLTDEEREALLALLRKVRDAMIRRCIEIVEERG